MDSVYASLKKLALFSILLTIGKMECLSQTLTREDVRIYKDIVYRIVDGRELKLDIAVPKYLKASSPVIVDFPGGAWRICNKSAEDALFYAEYGFVGVSAEYRTSDIAHFPAPVHDCKAVIRWLRAHAAEYQIDPDKIGVTGISAGAHLALLLGTSAGDKFLEGDGSHPEFSSRVQAVVDHFGPVDLLSQDDTTGLGLKNFNQFLPDESPEALLLGGTVAEKADLARLANPITYLDPKDPPIWIGHGEKDGMVLIRQSERLFDALRKAGVPTEFIRIKNSGHQYLPYKWDAIVSPSIAELSAMTMKWFQKWLGEPELDADAIAISKQQEKPAQLTRINLYYRLTIELPGKTQESYCTGNYMILCDGKVLARGEFDMRDLSTEEKRQFRKELEFSAPDLSGKEILWNFRGEIFDSKLSQEFGPMIMQGEVYDDSIEGVGYDIRVMEDGSFKIDKKVYRRSK